MQHEMREEWTEALEILNSIIEVDFCYVLFFAFFLLICLEKKFNIF